MPDPALAVRINAGQEDGLSESARMTAPIRRPKPLDIGLIVSLAAIWGSAFLAMKVAVPETGPVWLVAIRVLTGFLVLVPWALYRGLVWPRSGRQWGLIAAITALNVVVPFSLIAWGQQFIDAGVTALLMGTGPFAALIISHFTTTDDRMTATKLIAVCFGFSGVALVVGQSAFSGLGAHLWGMLAALTGSLCYVASGTLIRRVEGIPPTRLSALVFGLAALPMVPAALFLAPWPQEVSATVWAALIYLGVMPTGIAYILRYHLVRTVGLSYFALGMNLIPVFGVLFGAAILGEPLTVWILAALVLIVTGMSISRLGSLAPEPAAPESDGRPGGSR